MIHSFALLILAAGGPPFTSLFDGKTLAGWEVCNGYANYRVEDGLIVGTTAAGSPNSFLCTTREYGDFVLEFETRTDSALNSGVQIRSHRYPAETTVLTFNGKETQERKHPAGRVYGYQVEISNEKSGNSGGVYDEARRGWLDQAACKALRDNQWNHYRVVAVGDSIKTWVNGVPCADLMDSVDLAGFIALQVHNYKGEQPAQVRWRNLRLQDLGRHIWKPLATSRSFQDVTVRVRFQVVSGSGLLRIGGSKVEINDAHPAARKGQWNELAASVHGSRLVVHLNGIKTLERSQKPERGRVAMLAAPGADVRFRDSAVLEPARP